VKIIISGRTKKKKTKQKKSDTPGPDDWRGSISSERARRYVRTCFPAAYSAAVEIDGGGGNWHDFVTAAVPVLSGHSVPGFLDPRVLSWRIVLVCRDHAAWFEVDCRCLADQRKLVSCLVNTVTDLILGETRGKSVDVVPYAIVRSHIRAVLRFRARCGDWLAQNLLNHSDEFSRFVPVLLARHPDVFVVTGSTVGLSHGVPPPPSRA
jgi:hypothetical protein